jgi:arylsulfatase A-like enzyme
VDSQIARVLEKLRELHLDESTIIVLTCDHGYQLGEHGLWAKQTLFEGANHVPLIIAAPGVKPGSRSGLAEQVDIYPTLCDLAGLPKPKHLQGRSLKPMLDDPSTKGKQVAISTMIAPHTKQTGHSLRTDAFRYIAWESGEELLYDLRTDADELHNLAKQTAQAERMTRMRQRLATHLKSVVESSGLR